MYAAGLSLREENLQAFIDRFMEQAARDIGPEQMTPQIDIDTVISLRDINTKLMADLKRMEPLGPENERPVFATMHVRDHGTSRRVGRELEHLKLELTDRHGGGPVHGIAFTATTSSSKTPSTSATPSKRTPTTTTPRCNSWSRTSVPHRSLRGKAQIKYPAPSWVGCSMIIH